MQSNTLHVELIIQRIDIEVLKIKRPESFALAPHNLLPCQAPLPELLHPSYVAFPLFILHFISVRHLAIWQCNRQCSAEPNDNILLATSLGMSVGYFLIKLPATVICHDYLHPFEIPARKMPECSGIGTDNVISS